MNDEISGAASSMVGNVAGEVGKGVPYEGVGVTVTANTGGENVSRGR